MFSFDTVAGSQRFCGVIWLLHVHKYMQSHGGEDEDGLFRICVPGAGILNTSNTLFSKHVGLGLERPRWIQPPMFLSFCVRRCVNCVLQVLLLSPVYRMPCKQVPLWPQQHRSFMTQGWT